MSPILFLLTESMASLGMPMVPSGFLTGATSTGSQSIGAPAAAKILQTREESMQSRAEQSRADKVTNSCYFPQIRCGRTCPPVRTRTNLCTALAISGPIPSPGMSVTMVLPLPLEEDIALLHREREGAQDDDRRHSWLTLNMVDAFNCLALPSFTILDSRYCICMCYVL